MTAALRRRIADLGPQDYGDESREIAAAHFFLPGTRWDWYVVAYDEDGGVPQFFCLVRGQAVELGYVALAELEAARSPWGLAVERDEDWWTEAEAADGKVPSDAEYLLLAQEG